MNLQQQPTQVRTCKKNDRMIHHSKGVSHRFQEPTLRNESIHSNRNRKSPPTHTPSPQRYHRPSLKITHNRYHRTFELGYSPNESATT
jgi:hypothetical protein